MCQQDRCSGPIKALLISLLSFSFHETDGWQPPGSVDDVLASLVPEVSNLPGLSIDWQAQTELLWQQHKHKVSYCIGDKVCDQAVASVVPGMRPQLLAVD